MNFQEAIQVLRVGGQIRRQSWNNKSYRWFARTFDATIRSACNQYKSNNAALISVADCAAEDWEEYKEPTEALVERIEKLVAAFERGVVPSDINTAYIVNVLKQAVEAIDVP